MLGALKINNKKETTLEKKNLKNKKRTNNLKRRLNRMIITAVRKF